MNIPFTKTKTKTTEGVELASVVIQDVFPGCRSDTLRYTLDLLYLTEREENQIQPEYGDEQADAGRDCRNRLTRPNSEARTGTGEYYFPCLADHEQDWQPYPVDLYSAICDDHTYVESGIQAIPIRVPPLRAHGGWACGSCVLMVGPWGKYSRTSSISYGRCGASAVSCARSGGTRMGIAWIPLSTYIWSSHIAEYRSTG